jgi:hypothetical protein
MIDFKTELVVSERRPFSGRRSGPAARGVEADDSALENTVQSPVFPIGWKPLERAGIDAFDKESFSPAVAQEKPPGPSAGHFEGLRPQVLQGVIAEINIHSFDYSRRAIIG